MGLEAPRGQASDYAAWAGQRKDGLEGIASACFSAEVGHEAEPARMLEPSLVPSEGLGLDPWKPAKGCGC